MPFPRNVFLMSGDKLGKQLSGSKTKRQQQQQQHLKKDCKLQRRRVRSSISVLTMLTLSGLIRGLAPFARIIQGYLKFYLIYIQLTKKLILI